MSLTKQDLQQLKKVIHEGIREAIDSYDKKVDKKFTKLETNIDQKLAKFEYKFDQKLQNHPTNEAFAQFMIDVDNRFNQVDEKFEQLRQDIPNKDELFRQLDAILHEMKDHRTEQEVISYQISNHNDWIEHHDQLHHQLGLTLKAA